MPTLEELRESLPEQARDIKMNLQNVLAESTLNDAQRWGVAIACAFASRSPTLAKALIGEGKADAAVIEDAKTAAAIMGMNNVFYRFRHVMGKDSYKQKPARLRMTRIARPATNKPDFELFCLAVSAVNNCEACMKSHEEAVLAGGLTEDHIFDAVRIASTMHAAAVSLELSA